MSLTNLIKLIWYSKLEYYLDDRRACVLRGDHRRYEDEFRQCT